MAALALLLLIGCGNDSKTRQPKLPPAPPVANIIVPEFNADSAYAFVAYQTALGPRVPNSVPHEQLRAYIINRLEGYKTKVTLQEFTETAFDGTRLQLTNIVGSFNPAATKRILLAAHWDTRPFADKDSVDKTKPIDGANDGASGVAVLLELARVLASNELPTVGVDMLFFDGEDYGKPEGADRVANDRVWYCLGSQYWGKNKHVSNYSAYYGILLDMVGAKGATFYQEVHSNEFAPSIVKKVWDTSHQLGYGNYFSYKAGGAVLDDHYYVNTLAKIPMINIIDFKPQTFFFKHHHTHGDNLECIDPQTLKAVGQTLMQVLYTEK